MEKTYECRFAMYLKYRGIKSSIYGKTLIDAIKNRNQYAILVSVIDEDGKEYICKEHDKSRGPKQEYGYYWVEKDNETNIIYDEYQDEDVYPLKDEIAEPIYSEIYPIDKEEEEICDKCQEKICKEKHNTPNEKEPVLSWEETWKEKCKIYEEYGKTDDDDDLPLSIPHTYGAGMKFKDDKGEEYTTYIDLNSNNKRTVNFRITSFRGISPGAIHYYGKLYYYDLPLIKEDSSKCNIGGYFDRFKPKECLSIDIEIVRLVEAKEIYENPERWKGYDVGTYTNAFYTKEEVIKKGTEIFKKRFTGDWELIIDSCC